MNREHSQVSKAQFIPHKIPDNFPCTQQVIQAKINSTRRKQNFLNRILIYLPVQAKRAERQTEE